MKSVRIGIVGVGNMGSNHSRWLQEGKVSRCKLTAVCDSAPFRLEPYKDAKDIKTFGDSKELIRSGEVDAVIIATPHYEHTTVGIDAMENGLHVLTEKPISVHKADAERLIAAYEKNKKKHNLKFSAMFQMRTYPHFKKVKKLVATGELGEVQRTNWVVTAWFRSEVYYRSSEWRATWKGEGGGVLLNQCPHNLDLFQWICGVPSKVYATCGFGKYHDIEVEDDVTAYLEYPNGATGVFVTSTGEAPGTDRLEIAGDRGKLVMEGGKIMFTRTEISVREWNQVSQVGFKQPETWLIDVPVQEETAGHSVITQSWIDAILDDAPLIAPAEEGIHSVEMANAMLYSAWTGQAVDVPLDGKAYEAELKKRIKESKFEKKVGKPLETDITASFR